MVFITASLTLLGEEDMATAFVRGAQTMNSMFVKPMGRKGFHRKSSSPDMMRERMETESKEVKSSNRRHVMGESTPWVPDGRTGIFYPKGQEKVLESIPDGGGAAVNTQVNWFNDENS